MLKMLKNESWKSLVYNNMTPYLIRFISKCFSEQKSLYTIKNFCTKEQQNSPLPVYSSERHCV